MKDLKYTIEQVNFTVGDFAGNFSKIKSRYNEAIKSGVSLAIFSELAITGYPIQDLALNKDFVDMAQQYLDKIACLTKVAECAVLVGGLYQDKGRLYNAAFFIAKGKIIKTVIKNCLPNYGVFDEKRVFSELKNDSRVIDYNGLSIGVLICEDGWNYNNIDGLENQNIDLIISINASPFSILKPQQRIGVCQAVAKKYKVSSIYVNHVGGQDSLVFDGGSFVCSHDGKVVVSAESFSEDTVILNIDYIGDKYRINPSKVYKYSKEEMIYSALVLGLRDYVHKNGHQKVILGVSGGIDSALVSVIAVDALGADNVMGVMLSSQYTSDVSIRDAEALTKSLGIKYRSLSIEKGVYSIVESLETELQFDITSQNIQSRLRGVMLMALSNDQHMLLLSTSNKSELSVGYSTLYGDSCGAYFPLKDVYKTEVFALAVWRNRHIPKISLFPKTQLISDSIIKKVPSAELGHDQKDEDYLPKYEVLDRILFCILEKGMSEKEILQEGFDKSIVYRVKDLLLKSEFKRQQSVLGPKVSEVVLNIDRRYPITNKFFKK